MLIITEQARRKHGLPITATIGDYLNAPIIEEAKAQQAKIEATKKVEAEERARREKEEQDRTYNTLYQKDVGSLIKELGNLNTTTRKLAAYILGVKKEKRAVNALIEALRDDDANVVVNAIYALGEIGDPRALENLRRLNDPRFEEQKQIAIQKLKQVKFEHMAKGVNANIDEMSWQSFEDKIIEALSAVASDRRSGDMGMDGITKDGIPIQIKQSENIGRNVVDNFETALRRYYPPNTKYIKGIIVAKSFTKGAYDEAVRTKKDHNIDIQLITTDELDI
jgi:hypothetical protein